MLDLIIIGGSAAAVSAAIYAVRHNLNFKIITKDLGGEVATAGEIYNYPGILKTTGIELAKNFQEQLEYNNVAAEEGAWVEKIEEEKDGNFVIRYKKGGEEYEEKTKTVIVATGTRPRHLDIPGEKEFYQKGATYCTVCDGPLFKNKAVAVIGGGNSANEAGIMLSDIASKVYILTVNPDMTGEEAFIKKLKSFGNVEIIGNASVTKILGDKKVTGLEYQDKKTGEIKNLNIAGVFIHIGMEPNSQIVPEEVEKNERGEIKINKLCETNIPGLFAIGDVADVPFNQIIIAAGQGAIAALQVVDYLNKLK